ncbi:hypothetical protein MALU111345_05900 [Marinicrinis lubricantis]
MIMCIVLAACQNDEQPENESENQVEVEMTNNEEAAADREALRQQQFEDSLAASYQISKEETYQLPVSAILHEQPAAATSSSYVHELEQGDEVAVIGALEEMVQVVSGDKSGWIAAWLLTSDAKQIKQVEPYEMIVGTPVVFSMYPDQETPYGFELAEGKVVQVHREYEDWVDVRYISGESAYLDNHWIPKSALVPYEPELAKDGLVKPGTEYWLDFQFGVWVTGATETELEVEGPGGAGGTIAKEDFIPNPFTKPMLSIRYIPPMNMTQNWQVAGFDGEQVILKQNNLEIGEGASSEETAAEEKREISALINQVTGFGSYPFQFYLQFDTVEIELSSSEEFKQQFESDASFRMMLNEMLHQPLTHLPIDLTLTPEYMSEALK